MFRLWGKVFKDNRMLKDTVFQEENHDINRTKLVFQGLENICYQFDLGNPIWLEATIAEFKRHSKARFTQDSFVEQIDFDYLEIQVIEEA